MTATFTTYLKVDLCLTYSVGGRLVDQSPANIGRKSRIKRFKYHLEFPLDELSPLVAFLQSKPRLTEATIHNSETDCRPQDGSQGE